MKLPGVQFSQRRLNTQSGPVQSIEQTGLGAGAGAAFAAGMSEEAFAAEQREQESEFAEALSGIMLQEQQEFERMRVERQESPEGFTDDYLKSFEERYNKSKPKDISPFKQRLFDDKFTDLKNSLASKAISYESSQKTAVQRQRLAIADENMRNLVARDPSQLAFALSQIDENYARAQASALIPNAILARDEAREGLYSGVVDRYIADERYGDANTFLKNNAEQVGDRYSSYKKAIKNGLKQQEELARFEKMMRNSSKSIEDGAFNPYNPKDTKAADKYFEAARGYEALFATSPDAADLTLMMAEQGYIPKQAEDAIAGMFLNGSKEQKIYAADLASKVRRSNPALGQTFLQGDEFDDMHAYNAFLNYMPAEQAMQEVMDRQQVSPEIQQARKDRLSAIHQKEKGKGFNLNDLRNIVENEKNSGFFDAIGLGSEDFNPIEVEELGQRATQLRDHYFIKYGDAEAAKKAAIDAMSVQMGVSYASGKPMIMENAPEDLMGIDGAEKDDLNKFIKRKLDGHLGGNSPEKFYITSDEFTKESLSLMGQRDPNNPQRTLTGQPYGYSYQLYEEVDTGFDFDAPMMMKDEDGNPLRLYIDPEEFQSYVGNEKITKAKQRRATREFDAQIRARLMQEAGEMLGVSK